MAEIDTGVRGAVMTITLNRPRVLNALDASTQRELLLALQAARSPDVRAVILTGAGRAFCVGQDLEELRSTADIAELLRTLYRPNILALRSLDKPVIAAVNGVAAGAGLSLACACDVRIAAEPATFIPAFVGVGLVPDAGATYSLARLLGPARAFEWMIANTPMTAAAALATGIISEIVEADALAQRASDLAATYAAGPTRAFALTKQLFEASAHTALEEQLEREALAQSDASRTSDHVEGLRAFLDKRKASFRGR